MAPKIWLELAWIIPIIAVCATFALRPAPPEMRHDWIWPNVPHTLLRWLAESALSEWNPHGLGSAGQTPTFNVVLAVLAFFGLCGIPTNVTLFCLLLATFGAASAGILHLLKILDVRIDRFAARALALSYAFGPVAFEKAVAGHIYWLCAYASLPWFAACIWSACVVPRTRHRAFLAAALLYVVASTQIQFIVFDLFVAVVIAVVVGRSRPVWLGVSFIVVVGLLHNANPALGVFRSADEFLFNRSHATDSWEIALSAPFLELATFGGYFHYDRLAIGGLTGQVFAAARTFTAVLTVSGLLRPDYRALVFAIIGYGALIFASGWNGPLAQAMVYALHHSNFFTLFRELYHVMALYALASTVLIALALARLPVSIGRLASLAVFVTTLPFISLGLNRSIPAVAPVPGETETGYRLPFLRILLPEQEPISADHRDFGGLDPARLSDDVLSSGQPILAVRSIVEGSLPQARWRALLADLGVDSVQFRNDRTSVVRDSFQANTGADFAMFEANQRSLALRLRHGIHIDNARPELVEESLASTSPLDAYLADAQLPPGGDLTLTSSYDGNDIRREWVAGRIWSFEPPDFENVVADPVITESNAPLTVRLPVERPDYLYVLASGPPIRIDGLRADIVAGSQRGSYHWYRSRLAPGARQVELRAAARFPIITSVARATISAEGDWRPTSRTVALQRSVALAATRSSPWSLRTILPPSRQSREIVFRQSFGIGWHLDAGGIPYGAPVRVHGLFDGWMLPPASHEVPIVISYAPEPKALTLVAVSVVVETLIFVMLVAASFRRNVAP